MEQQPSAQEVAPLVAAPVAVPKPSLGSPTSLAPGFRFHPTDEELVRYYLRRRVCGKPFRFPAVSEIDVYKSEPWELAEYSYLNTRDLEWYFFSPVDRKYGNGSRLNRATEKGYWKATGKDRPVRHKSQTVGMKKTLVFHLGRAPDGKRTNWVMHEYRLSDADLELAGVAQNAFVLCRIFQKSGLGPPNGERYAPFVEEDWDDDSALVVPKGLAEDDLVNGDDAPLEGDNSGDACKAPTSPIAEPLLALPYACKRERSEEDCEPLSLTQSKKCKKSDAPSSSHANGSEDSTTTSHGPLTLTMMTTNDDSQPTPLELPFLETRKPTINATFDASMLEKSVPPGYLKFINNLEKEILNVSMERESMKIEVMRAQAMIDNLHLRIDLLIKENEVLRRRG